MELKFTSSQNERFQEEVGSVGKLGFAKEVGTMGRNLIPQVKVLPRADRNKDFDPEHWTLVVVEQGIGDQILFLSVMEEAIEEFKNIFLLWKLE